MVVKADGLAAGKGVTVAETREAAIAAVEACFSSPMAAGGIVIEEFLEGEEASFFALVDGTHAIPLASAQDHKRAFDGDKGPNTGGMGAYSPAPVVTPEIARRAMDEIIWPTVRGMAARGTPYKGVLYAGLMITESGPKLIEYNVRFGDPEAQVLMLRLKSDLLAALLATADGVLNAFDVRWYDDAAIVVVMAANGYPGDYARGGEIRGLEAARAVEGVEIFHAGTARDDGRLVAAGGRVLNVAARGRTLVEARERAYAAVARIDWPGAFYRSDIGWRALQREKPRA
jgi:phosphoribosylamine--glycine ligase